MRAKTKTVIQQNVEHLILATKREIERDLELLTAENPSMAGMVAMQVAKRSEYMRGISDALTFMVNENYLFPGMKLADLVTALKITNGMTTMSMQTMQNDSFVTIASTYVEGQMQVRKEIARAIERKTGKARSLQPHQKAYL